MANLEQAAREAVLQHRCEQVLHHLIPNYKDVMTLTQCENAINALKTIAKPIEHKKHLIDKNYEK